MIFDAYTGDLITAVLCPGNRGATGGVVSVLKRLVKKMRRKLGKKLYFNPSRQWVCHASAVRFWESQKLSYVIGFACNSRLQASIDVFVEKVMAEFQRTQEAQRQFTELLYQADTWDRPRRMIAKVEVSDLGLDRPFVVTNRPLVLLHTVGFQEHLS